MSALPVHLAAAVLLFGLLVLVSLLPGCDAHGTCGADNRDPLCHQSW